MAGGRANCEAFLGPACSGMLVVHRLAGIGGPAIDYDARKSQSGISLSCRCRGGTFVCEYSTVCGRQTPTILRSIQLYSKRARNAIISRSNFDGTPRANAVCDSCHIRVENPISLQMTKHRMPIYFLETTLFAEYKRWNHDVLRRR